MSVNYSPRGATVELLAREEADRGHIKLVTTDHLLIALLLVGDGPAATVLTDLGVEPDAVRRAARENAPRPLTSSARNAIPIAYGVQRVVEAAEALAGNQPVEPEHLLYAMLELPGGLAARTLVKLGLDLGAVRDRLDAVLAVG